MPKTTFTDYQRKAVRSALILTNSFVAGTTISEVSDMNQLILDVEFTIGSLTSGEVKVEFSEDNSTFIQQVTLSVSSGTITASLGEFTVTAAGNYRLEIPIMTRFIKVSAKGTGTVTASSMTINALVGVR